MLQAGSAWPILFTSLILKRKNSKRFKDMQATNSTIYHNLSARSRSRPVACVWYSGRYLNLTTLLCSNNTIMIWLTPVTFELGKMINHRRICTFWWRPQRIGITANYVIVESWELVACCGLLIHECWQCFNLVNRALGTRKTPRNDLVEEANVYFVEYCKDVCAAPGKGNQSWLLNINKSCDPLVVGSKTALMLSAQCIPAIITVSKTVPNRPNSWILCPCP